jgi:hypothetical protein
MYSTNIRSGYETRFQNYAWLCAVLASLYSTISNHDTTNVVRKTVYESAEVLRLDTHTHILSVDPAGYPPSLEVSHNLMSAGSSFSLQHGIKKISLRTAMNVSDQIQHKSFVMILS